MDIKTLIENYIASVEEAYGECDCREVEPEGCFMCQAKEALLAAIRDKE